jgi:tetratricopeptide (TPR) repeat protein
MNKKILKGAIALMLVAGFATAQKVKSKKEYDAYLEIQNEKDPDQIAKKVDEFLAKYADTQLKTMVLNLAADAQQRKGDSVKALVYAQSALDSDPKDYQAMLLISGELARQTRENDLDKEEKLAKSEKLAHDAINAIQSAAKPNPQVTDDQWAGYKKDLTSQGHEDLGMAALARKKMDVAVAEFKLAVDGAATPDAGTMVRLAAAYNQSGKPDDAIAVCTKVLAMSNLHPAVKKFAETEKARAEQAKNGKS